MLHSVGSFERLDPGGKVRILFAPAQVLPIEVFDQVELRFLDLRRPIARLMSGIGSGPGTIRVP